MAQADAVTVRKHLKVLASHPELLDLYRALNRIALDKLPARHVEELKKVLG